MRLPNSRAKNNTVTTRNARSTTDELIERIDTLKFEDPESARRQRYSWLSSGAAREFAVDSEHYRVSSPKAVPVDDAEHFFAALQWTKRAEWVGVRYDIAPTTPLLVHPSIRLGDGYGVILLGEGWRCTRNGGCGFEDLRGLVVKRRDVELVDLAATVDFVGRRAS